MKQISKLVLVLAAAAALPMAAYAANSGTNGNGSSDTGYKTSTAALSDGEVKKVDKDAGKITIKHGPLANLDMPGMTMVFRVKDPAMLEQVKAGDKVKFTVEKLNGALTVMAIEAAK